MLELLFLLLPVAMAYGWFMGRNSVKQNRHSEKQDLSSKFSTGLNYLLSNQQDEAIDYLLEALNLEDDTVEAHFAMANLFRKRGELDRALKIHEHLVLQKHLPNQYKHQAIFELAKDFYTAGLYDRAEAMFVRLLKVKQYRSRSLDFLLQIYQSTKDWQLGIALERIVRKVNDKKLKHGLANFYCEIASGHMAKDENIEALEALEKALDLDPLSCRSNQLMANIYEKNEQYQQAIDKYVAIYDQDKEYFPDVIDAMQACYEALDEEDKFIAELKRMHDETGSASLLIKYAQFIEQRQGTHKAASIMLSAMKRRPTISGFKHFVNMQASSEAESGEQLAVIKELISAYLSDKHRYNCRNCGFNSSVHYWSCPSCHEWEQLKPVRGFEGE
ncbi:lipopolysaccharide assembly protein LapB [Thalassotalea agarivorans]|uniref:Lipopolysaccharide assembly protein B n=1 Tax=Thalassotalea agarivorans TaxID=349064 RepID=A0A1I0HBV1_THASX|nr:lipopolysaccharide assembly protein LapB [Thalassotalea agarivorans]SET81280.1 Lipopolysaccharide biosynthesis regulator YciM, contains six TPR domains and a predicted metal-binding C-terminal domain [Thalassotalea agarivorans]